MKYEKIFLAQGTGGRETEELIKNLIIPGFTIKNVPNGVGLTQLDDSGAIPVGDSEYIITSIDSYTVDPIFFPGGNIGTLAASGSINDVAVMGAKPIAVMDSIVVEEGFPIQDLKRIIASMNEVFEYEHVAVLGGDFKVMPKGKLDKIIITTNVIGTINKNRKPILDSGIKPSDKIIISGTIAEHGATILALQSGIEALSEGLMSDCQPITKAMEVAMNTTTVHAAKDPTRGGLAQALNEFAEKSNLMIKIYEEEIPIREEVKALVEMLGVDPLFLASEGRVILAVSEEDAEKTVKQLRKNGFPEAAIIGEAVAEKPGFVVIETLSGGLRVINRPFGEIVPRIC
ncbi:MAG: hydrogenase expression/formation protein HypE [Candidatus Njordarchaeia archaeon]